jgi:DNA-binding NarL/FixJ family response regulator
MKPTSSRTKPTPSRVAPKAAGAKRSAKHRVMLVDDHPIIRDGLGTIINQQADLEVCGEAGDAAAAMSALSKMEPDLLVTDLTMPGRSGIDFIRDVHAMRPGLPILVLSMHDEMLHAERVLRAGARGYVMKDAGVAKMLEVMRLLLSGKSYVSPKLAARLLDAMTGHRPRGSKSPIEKLSDREFEVFQLLGSGQSTKEVAETLKLSTKTVDVHRSHIKEKLQLKDASSLVHYAIRWVETQSNQG